MSKYRDKIIRREGFREGVEKMRDEITVMVITYGAPIDFQNEVFDRADKLLAEQKEEDAPS